MTAPADLRTATDLPPGQSPWPALWALVVGFFMILVDSTIVSVATPAIMAGLGTDVSTAIWVTSAYLLAFAVPLLVTGRLGDRFGPKNVYLTGLTVFTLASLWCGLTDSVDGLIWARVVQGLGASMMTPQTMAVITRTFPATRRGSAMALWGAVAGLATLVGPILGGVLVDSAGWESIFLVNVPVGVVAFVLAWRWVPRLPTHSHSFDVVGVALSAVGMFLVVFGLQEGQAHDWGPIVGLISVPALIAAGVLVMAAFVWWQSRIRTEPLVPLRLFRDRNFSLANAGISMVAFAITSMALPFMFYAQGVHGYTPTQAALLMVPMAVISGGLAPVVGRLVDILHPRPLSAFGFVATAAGLFLVTRAMTPGSEIWHLLAPMAIVGVGSAFLWAPLSTTATRNLPMASAGAGAGVYNTTRQVGAVLGSAAIAAAISARLAAHLPGAAGSADRFQATGGAMPPEVAAPFAAAMAEAMLAPVAALLVGAAVVLFFERPGHLGASARARRTADAAARVGR